VSAAARTLRRIETIDRAPVAVSEIAERDVVHAVFEGPAPCDRCPFAARCRDDQLACEQFRAFVHGVAESRWRVAPRWPTRELYAMVFDEAADDRKSGRPPKAVDPVSAARASGEPGACGVAARAGDSGF
jgi:hypothetical protein